MATPLHQLPKEKRALILHCMLLLLLGLENYSSYSRVLLLHLASSLHIPMHVLAQDELRVAHGLSMVIKGIPPEEIAQKRAEEGKAVRRMRAGQASTVSNSSADGLATPLMAAGIGTVFGGLGLKPSAAAGLLGTMAEGTVVVGTLFGLYGARATAKMMDSYVKDTQDFGLAPVHGYPSQQYLDPKDVPAEDRRLRMVICIGGWLMNDEDVVRPWQCLGRMNEPYGLRWEVDPLLKLGNALDTLIKSSAWTDAKKEVASRSGELELLYQNTKHIPS